jgi:hypothetical protein
MCATSFGFAEFFQPSEIPIDESLLFCVSPPLELSLSPHGVFFGRNRFRVRENNRFSAGRPRGTTPGVVGCHAITYVRRMSDVETAVRAAEDVDENGAGLGHSARLCKECPSTGSGHSTRYFDDLQARKKPTLAGGLGGLP